MASKGQKFRKYTPEEKLRAVKLYLEDGYSFKSIAKDMNIPEDSTVSRWVKEYETFGPEYFTRNNRAIKSGRPRKKFKSPEEEIEYWKAENAVLRELLESKKKLQSK